MKLRARYLSILFLVIVSSIVLVAPSISFATLGVGVGTGKIMVDEKLKPGTIYQLPPLSIINTGDEGSDYEASISYHENQPELAPPKSWFMFSPEKFHLEPGDTQTVEIKLNLPLRTEPGDYFAYVEGHPLSTAQSGETAIGIAAAAKLYFTVIPGSFFEGLYYKVLSFWRVYAPWPQRILIGLSVVALLVLFKGYFNIEVNLKKEPKQSKKDKHTNTTKDDTSNKTDE